MLVRQPRRPWSGGARHAAPLLGSLLLTLAVSPPARAAEVTYKIQRIVKLGDPVADVVIKPSGNWIVLDGLNDRGQIVFSTATVANQKAGTLLQYADDQFTVIAGPGRDGPSGVWPNDFPLLEPSSLNQAGYVVFSVDNKGVFQWDAQTRTTTPLLVRGMPVSGGLTLSGTYPGPAINNKNEVALHGWGWYGPNNPWFGSFLRRADGKIETIAISGKRMPDGRTVIDAGSFALNDAGMVTFLALADNSSARGAYLWDKGTISSVAVLGTAAPEGGSIRDVKAALLNNQNRSVLVLAAQRGEGSFGLYRFAEGKLTAVAVPGQTMPDGGKLSDIVLDDFGVSNANELGQHAFLAKLEDGSTAAYLLEPDGNLSLILKSGQITDLGKITLIGRTTRQLPAAPPAGIFGSVGGFGIGLNRQGQVALTVRLDNGPTTLVLLTPNTAPSSAGN